MSEQEDYEAAMQSRATGVFGESFSGIPIEVQTAVVPDQEPQTVLGPRYRPPKVEV